MASTNLNIQASDPVLKGEKYHPNKWGYIDGCDFTKLVTISTMALGILGILATIGVVTYQGMYLHTLSSTNWTPLGISIGLVVGGGFGGRYCVFRRDQQRAKFIEATEGLTPDQKAELNNVQSRLDKKKKNTCVERTMENLQTQTKLHILITKDSIHYFANAETLQKRFPAPKKQK